MNYEMDLFISYAHLDDRPLTRQQQGWVSQFHESLENALGYCGHKAAIWRDQKLAGNDIFNKEILEQLAKAAILVSVLSPAYVASEYCRKEVEEFYKAAEQNGKITVGNKSRIIKVIKRPLESEEHLPAFMKQKEIEGYQFYKLENDNPLELDPAWGTDLAQEYARRVLKLANDIAQLIDRMRGAAPSVASVSSPKPSVYLAQCSRDRKDARDALLTELQLLGYNVFPAEPLPMEEEAFRSEVSRLLSQCSLSIHLVGTSYGAIPDGPCQKSVVVLENELAAKRSKTGGLLRIIWLPDGTAAGSPEQQQFIEALRRDRETQFGADLISDGLETLKGQIHSALRKLEGRELQREKPLRRQPGTRLVYLICDKKDREATRGLRKRLRDSGFDIEIPVFEGDAATVREANKETLAQCNAAILFYGVGDEIWMRTVENDLRKGSAYRDARPPVLSFTYIAGPATDDKRDMIELEDPNVINGLEGLQEVAVESLLEALQQA